MVEIWIDYNNLEYFMTTKKLNLSMVITGLSMV